ncbi:hypothetical protein TBR22_A17790 [Luteitalea sp. TBR-22]|uniref:YdcF family protein n=1 Tax=Luteitalea sp. TBR-22 TaxID=2802971 RepID=UPI001AFA242F|nr:YdcF family protein [Luteitalea sp. TBR-22]BCS32565.1 hypothetical protein TBR22_A17790 [Luteitalea sp. TBR-22]
MRRVFRVVMRFVRRVVVAWAMVCAVLVAAVVSVGMIDRPAPADVIVVLGAALTDEGAPGKALTRRSEHAADLWTQGFAGMVICAGGIGPDAWIQRSEADGCREVLMRHGVPRDRIVLEETSRTTAENARNAGGIMARHGWRRALVVSDSYHVFRARVLCRRAGMDVVTSPVPVSRVGSPLFYVMSVVREVGALHVQLFR